MSATNRGPMDITISFSTQEGWGTHAAACERLTVADPNVDDIVGSLRSAAFGAVPDASFTLRLEYAVPSPIADQAVLDGLVDLCWFRAVDLERIVEFDRRITARYTEFCSTIGEHYMGSFVCPALGADVIAELAWHDDPDFATADARSEVAVIPDDVQQIIAECRELQQREEPRYAIRFTPHRAPQR